MAGFPFLTDALTFFTVLLQVSIYFVLVRQIIRNHRVNIRQRHSREAFMQGFRGFALMIKTNERNVTRVPLTRMAPSLSIFSGRATVSGSVIILAPFKTTASAHIIL